MVTTTETISLQASDLLPKFDPGDLDRLRTEGLFGLGVIAFIFDHRGQVLMLEHAAGADRPEQLLGPVSEKSKYYTTADGSNTKDEVQVESTAQTLRRGMEEELGIGNVDVDFEIIDPAYWVADRQLHDDDPLKRRARAVVAVMRTLDPKLLTASYLSRSDEIVSADFYDFESLLMMPEAGFRPGTADFLWKIATNTSHEPFITGAYVGQLGTMYRLGSSALGTSGLVGLDVDFTKEAA